MSARKRGFTLIELVITLTLAGLMIAVAAPRVGDAMRTSRLDRAVRTVVLDLEQALTTAARQRAPVRISQPVGTRELEVRNVAGSEIYLSRDFGPGADFQVDFLALSPTTVNVFPTGRTSSALTITLRTGEQTRVVSMSPAGRVRVVQ